MHLETKRTKKETVLPLRRVQLRYTNILSNIFSIVTFNTNPPLQFFQWWFTTKMLHAFLVSSPTVTIPVTLVNRWKSST